MWPNQLPLEAEVIINLEAMTLLLLEMWVTGVLFLKLWGFFKFSVNQ